jgi:dsRNA-specific ribonuclease
MDSLVVLNEVVMRNNLPRPVWAVTSAGDAHRRVWRAVAHLPGIAGEYPGEASTKTEARRRAAASLLQSVAGVPRPQRCARVDRAAAE